MLKINRLKIDVKTSQGNFGFDETFEKRINFIASFINTKGKSSCIEAMYYCLGVEELIGGTNEKSLKPVFRKSLEYNGKDIPVLESNFYLEIKNSKSEIATIYRSAKKENYKPNLVTVYYGNLDDVENGLVRSEDMYVHTKGSATNQKGFHKYLETFLKWELPFVPSYEESDTKLYLQTVFSAIFIEQKRGWSDLFATIPTYLKIKEPQKRIVEFLIGLETLKNEKLRQQIKIAEMEIKSSWKETYKSIFNKFNNINCIAYGLPSQPTILDENFRNKVSLFKKIGNDSEILLTDYINELDQKIITLNKKNANVGENIEELQNDLIAIKEDIILNERLLEINKMKLLSEKGSIESLIHSLEIINKDLFNNKDALKLKKLGSSIGWSINEDICPTCHQHINDSLLPQNINYDFMSIEDNIKHLDAQKSMMDFAINSHGKNVEIVESTINQLEPRLVSQRKIAHSMVNDIYSNDSMISESIIRNKLILENERELLIESLEYSNNFLLKFMELSLKWQKLLSDKALLPTENFTQNDKDTLKVLTKSFVSNLIKFGYSSIIDTSLIQISESKFLPATEGFDMKFDSSASDNIRAIWSYTIALMQTSNEFNGNHPNILIFDEPDQQSIVIDDLNNFFKTIINLKNDCQVIIGITMKDEETIRIINDLPKDKFKLILLEEKAISLKL